MRFGCPTCADVLCAEAEGDRAACGCGNVALSMLGGTLHRTYGVHRPVHLPTAADVLAFKLRMSGRPDEAVDVEDMVARLQEHGPC
jgi:hypothetical protein